MAKVQGPRVPIGPPTKNPDYEESKMTHYAGEGIGLIYTVLPYYDIGGDNAQEYAFSNYAYEGAASPDTCPHQEMEATEVDP